MKLHFIILTFIASFNIFGQDISFLKTTSKKNLHYLEFNSDFVTVYKMGQYYYKDGTVPAILLTDTLIFVKENEFKGKFYSLFKSGTNYTLNSVNGKKYQIELESNLKANTELNYAYCMKSHIDLSHKLNNEFPMSYYSFRNGYSAWKKQAKKSINHKEFIQQTDNETSKIYDSISKKQNEFIKTTNFITDNVKQTNYTILKDSISTLPLDWRPQNGYFDKSVYQMSKANPEYFYKLLQDFPTGKTFIYFAVNQDKELVKQLKQVQGYDNVKKEFLKDYRSGNSMTYRAIGMYTILIGLIAIIIVRS